jgi:hypothetical protein
LLFNIGLIGSPKFAGGSFGNNPKIRIDRFDHGKSVPNARACATCSGGNRLTISFKDAGFRWLPFAPETSSYNL